MSILVSGSVVFDEVASLSHYIRPHLAVEGDSLNVTFRPETAHRVFGGTGANIAYNLRRLGENPIIIGAVGYDFGTYADWLDRHGISREGIRVFDDLPTARCTILVDPADDRITLFHAGAMALSRHAPLTPFLADASIGIIAPSCKHAMLANARELRRSGIPFVVDPGPPISTFTGSELRELIMGSAVYTANRTEWRVTQQLLGMDEQGILELSNAIIATDGGAGSTLWTRHFVARIPAVNPQNVIDPVGCGDAHRAGLVYALKHGLGLLTGARLGSLLGALKIARRGPQALEEEGPAIHAAFEQTFGEPLGQAGGTRGPPLL